MNAHLPSTHAAARERAAAERWLASYIASGRRSFFAFPLAERRRLASASLCEILLQLSHALRKDHPQQMVHFAQIAVEVARLLPLPPFHLARVRDLEARTYGELANAYRVAGELPLAETALEQAYERCRTGTGSPRLFARLDDLAASLFADQRRFKKALRSLDRARTLYLRVDDPHAAGRILLKKGLFTGFDGPLETAVQLLTDGLNEIDRDRDPDLVYLSLHNIVFLTLEMGDLEKARDFLALLRPLAERRAGHLDRLKLCWLEGRVAARLGELGAAAQTFLEARRAFERAGLFYHAAGSGVDLAAVWFRQGRTAEVKGLVGELVAAFSRMRVEREAIAALLLLQEALDLDRATPEHLEQASAALERLAGRPRRP